jgi:hypothetical protein
LLFNGLLRLSLPTSSLRKMRLNRLSALGGAAILGASVLVQAAEVVVWTAAGTDGPNTGGLNRVVGLTLGPAGATGPVARELLGPTEVLRKEPVAGMPIVVPNPRIDFSLRVAPPPTDKLYSLRILGGRGSVEEKK